MEVHNELFKNLVFEGTRRYYIEDLTKKSYKLEYTTPHKLIFDNIEFCKNSWCELVCVLSEYLIENYKEKSKNIISFKCEWTKQSIFTTENGTNYKELSNNLFINCNHTSLHFCWLIQDLFDYFGIDKSKVYFEIHRSPSSEPDEIKRFFENQFKTEFRSYIMDRYKKDESSTDLIIGVFDKHLNPILATYSKGYNNFYLFDSMYMLKNCSDEVKNKINSDSRFDSKMVSNLSKYIDLILQFYRLQYFPQHKVK